MQCRNCRCYLDDEFRYCPRCGAPNSVAYPVAGAPWLRRPAAVVGLTVLLIAWLAALQRQLWLPHGASSPPATRVAARQPETVPALQQTATQPSRAMVPTASLRPRPTPPISSRGAQRPKAVRKNRDTRPAAPRAPAAHSRVLVARQPARPRGQSQSGDRPGARNRTDYLAALPDAPPGRFAPRRGLRLASRSRAWMTGSRRLNDPWSRPAVLVRSPGRESARPSIVASNLTVSISARPYGVKTFVYMDGGRELGIAPLRVQFDRPGRHSLFFFAPSLGRAGRVNRGITVTGGGRQWVSATMGSSREIARLSNL